MNGGGESATAGSGTAGTAGTAGITTLAALGTALLVAAGDSAGAAGSLAAGGGGTGCGGRKAITAGGFGTAGRKPLGAGCGWALGTLAPGTKSETPAADGGTAAPGTTVCLGRAATRAGPGAPTGLDANSIDADGLGSLAVAGGAAAGSGTGFASGCGATTGTAMGATGVITVGTAAGAGADGRRDGITGGGVIEGTRGMKVFTGAGTNIELLRAWPLLLLVLRAVTGDCDAERNACDALRGDVLGTVAVGVGTNMCAVPAAGGTATGEIGGTTGLLCSAGTGGCRVAPGMNTRGVVAGAAAGTFGTGGCC